MLTPHGLDHDVLQGNLNQFGPFPVKAVLQDLQDIAAMGCLAAARLAAAKLLTP